MTDAPIILPTFFVMFVLIVLGILWKPAVALVIAGILSIVGGAVAMVLGGLLGPSIGINAIIGGIVLVGISRLIEIAQQAVVQLRGLRRDLNGKPVEEKPPREAEILSNSWAYGPPRGSQHGKPG